MAGNIGEDFNIGSLDKKNANIKSTNEFIIGVVAIIKHSTSFNFSRKI